MANFISQIKGLEFFKFQEYPVSVGNPKSSSALCIVWQSLDTIIKFFPWLVDKCAIVGNLRSVFGANIILYNLALNPQIRRLYVWAPDKLSNTPIGVEGRNNLSALWKNPVSNLSVKIVNEVDLKIFEKIRTNVNLIDLSDQKKLTESMIPTLNEQPYMEKTIFPTFVVKAPDTMPSENYIYPIRVKKGADGYLSLLHHTWRYGDKEIIDRQSEEVKEIRGAIVVVEDEDPDSIFLPDWLTNSKELNISKESLENYYRTQFSPDFYNIKLFENVYKFERPRDYSYLYSELIFAYPRPSEIDDAVFRLFKKNGYKEVKKYLGKYSRLPKKEAKKLIKEIEKSRFSPRKKIKIMLEALLKPIDQVEYVIDRIKRKKEDLDKEIVLWDVWRNTELESGRPCLFKLSFSVRKNIIDVHVFVRSHDIFKAWFYNYFGITKLLGKISRETGYKSGFIIIESQSAHIYKRDWDSTRSLIKKLIDEKDPRMFFDPIIDSDPRGVVNVEVVDKKIKVKLQDLKTGNLLFEIKGRTARELLYKIKHLQLISRVDHGVFIGGELAKAEICIKLGVPYKYDNPIKLPTGESIVS